MGANIKIGITCGDLNGVGTEIIIKALLDKRVLGQLTPVVYADAALLKFYKNTIATAGRFQWKVVSSAAEALPDQVNVVACWTDELEIQPGIRNNKLARYAYKSLKQAVDDHKSGHIQAIVTAPIDKELMMQAGFDYPGHTEYLGEAYEGKPLMLMASQDLRVAVVTSHIGLAEVPLQISKKVVRDVIRRLNTSLQQDYDIEKPLIAVLGLNPHAGDQGRFGNEEEELILPAILETKDEGIMAMGPYPADGFFANGSFKKFDAVLAMYHDQGLIPFKVITGHRGVNVTCGLDVVRTSPDHGTAFDIAGQDLADHHSVLHALFMAVDVVRSRALLNDEKEEEEKVPKPSREQNA